MLPDKLASPSMTCTTVRLNAPTGAWCSLTFRLSRSVGIVFLSQCTYRCVVLPDEKTAYVAYERMLSQCIYRCVVLPDASLSAMVLSILLSQCTYRCVMLPDDA